MNNRNSLCGLQEPLGAERPPSILFEVEVFDDVGEFAARVRFAGIIEAGRVERADRPAHLTVVLLELKGYDVGAERRLQLDDRPSLLQAVGKGKEAVLFFD